MFEGIRFDRHQIRQGGCRGGFGDGVCRCVSEKENGVRVLVMRRWIHGGVQRVRVENGDGHITLTLRGRRKTKQL